MITPEQLVAAMVICAMIVMFTPWIICRQVQTTPPIDPWFTCPECGSCHSESGVRIAGSPGEEITEVKICELCKAKS